MPRRKKQHLRLMVLALVWLGGAPMLGGLLDYELTVYPLAWYDRTQYVHHLLLQKRDGTFYMVLWHEISNSDISSTPVREITPPDMPVTLTLNQAISSATVYFMDDFGNMFEAAPTISNNTLSLNVPDKAIILQADTQLLMLVRRYR